MSAFSTLLDIFAYAAPWMPSAQEQKVCVRGKSPGLGRAGDLQEGLLRSASLCWSPRSRRPVRLRSPHCSPGPREARGAQRGPPRPASSRVEPAGRRVPAAHAQTEPGACSAARRVRRCGEWRLPRPSIPGAAAAEPLVLGPHSPQSSSKKSQPFFRERKRA